VAADHSRVTSVPASELIGIRPAHGLADRLLQWSIAALVVAQAAVVGLQVVAPACCSSG
jgi:hypothetical protein